MLENIEVTSPVTKQNVQANIKQQIIIPMSILRDGFPEVEDQVNNCVPSSSGKVKVAFKISSKS